MHGWLAPRGPWDPRTYWTRRAVAIALALLLLAGVVAALVRLVPRQDPAATTAAAPSRTQSGAASVRPSTSTPTPPAASTQSPTPSTETPGATEMPAATPTPSSTPTGPPPCDPASLRLTVVAPPSVKSGTDQPFTLGIVNGASAACVLTVDQSTYELTVTSGSDLIWTTAHCPGWVPATTKTLEPEQGHEWSVTWNTHRSKPECETTGDYLKPGTYVAQAKLGDAESARVVMRLTG